jgi:hypothetical protein
MKEKETKLREEILNECAKKEGYCDYEELTILHSECPKATKVYENAVLLAVQQGLKDGSNNKTYVSLNYKQGKTSAINEVLKMIEEIDKKIINSFDKEEKKEAQYTFAGSHIILKELKSQISKQLSSLEGVGK